MSDSQIVHDHQQLLARGEPVGRAVVTQVWGSAPRPAGAMMLATSSGAILGSVSGGCVENAVAEEVAAAIARGSAKLVTFGVSDESAWEVGLSCGGTISVFVEPTVRDWVLDAAQSDGGVVIATVVAGPGVPGASWLLRDDGGSEPIAPPPGASVEERDAAMHRLDGVLDAVAAAARDVLARATSRAQEFTTADGETLTVLLELFPRQPKLVIFGGVHVAQALTTLARPLGFRTYVADGRAAWLTRERFPDADELVLGWPEEAFERIGLDARTYVVLLSHDPKFDEPATEIALRSPVPYIGTIGSRKTQAKRLTRLRAAGFTDTDLARVYGPVGLDLGGRQPMETALAIIAEITTVRYGAKGSSLSHGA
jgi:xanthine dehydrogenase accessory factor